MFSACSSSKYTKDTSASTDIKDNFILKILWISLNSFPKSVRTNFILEHLLMNLEVWITTEVIIILILILLHILSKLLLELNILKPFLRISDKALFNGWNVRFYLFRSIVKWLLIKLLILSNKSSRFSFLFFLFNFVLLLSRNQSMIILLSTGIIINLIFILRFLLIFFIKCFKFSLFLHLL
jgi:hypothetical protein